MEVHARKMKCQTEAKPIKAISYDRKSFYVRRNKKFRNNNPASDSVTIGLVAPKTR